MTISRFLEEHRLGRTQPRADDVPHSGARGLQNGKYEMGDMIAAGGMGRIEEARDINVRRTVAMKVMLTPEAPELDVLRFIGEAQITGQLEHPNIVPVHELGIGEDRQVFYTMKLVQGRTLSDILTCIAQRDDETIRAYSLQQLLGIYLKVCDAVAFAHSRGIVHRDIKPGNIMVGEFGEVYVMDWGLARRASVTAPDTSASRPAMVSSVRDDAPFDMAFTMAGDVVGTPRFMAPEQAEGRTDQQDQRTDVYALGAVLYAILTLRPPVEGATVDDVLSNISDHCITPPAQISPDRTWLRYPVAANLPEPRAEDLPHCPGGRVPPALSAVTMKCLEYAPGDRYSMVKDLQADVNAYLEGFPTLAEEAGLLRQILLMVRRHRGFVSSVAGVFVALAVGLVLTAVQWRQAEHARHAANAAQKNAESARDSARRARTREQELRQRAEYDAYLGQLARARRKIDQRAYVPAGSILAQCPLDHRGWEWAHLNELAQPWHRTAPGQSSVGLCANGRILVTGGPSVNIMKLPGLEPVAELQANSLVLAVSPDGSTLATAAGEVVSLSDLGQTRHLATRQPKPKGTIRALAFTPDSATVGVVNSGGTFEWLDATNGRRLWSYTPEETAALFSLAFSPSGKRVLLQGATSKLHGTVATLVDLTSRTATREFQSPSGSKVGFAAAFSPDGATIAWTTLTTVFLTHIEADRTIALQHEEWTRGTTVRALAFSPDGLSIYAGTCGQSMYQFNVRNGDCIRILRGHPGTVLSICPSPDGTELWSASQKHVLCHRCPPAPKGCVNTDLPRGFTFDLEVTRDGRIIAWNDVLTVWDPWNATLREFACLPKPRAVALHQPSQRIAVGDGDGRLELRSVKDEELLATWTAPGGRIVDIDWFPDGRELVTLTADNALRIWDVQGRTAIRKIPVNAAWDAIGVRVHPDGKTLYTNALQSCLISRIDLAGEQDTVDSDRLVIPRLFLSEFTPDGTGLVTASQMTVLLLDAHTLRPIREFHGHSGQVQAVAVSPDGQRIFSGGTDGVLRVWDLHTGRELLDMPGHQTTVTGLRYATNGRFLASCDAAGAIRLWLSRPGPPSAAPHQPEETAAPDLVRLWFDFETCAPGTVPSGWRVYGDSGQATIGACTGEGVESSRCLRLTDGPEPAQNFQPFTNCFLNPRPAAGTWTWSFDIRLPEAGAFLACWSGEGSYPDALGPYVSMGASTGLAVRGMEDDLLPHLPADEWLHVTVTCPLGSPHATWSLRVKQNGVTLLERDGLPITGQTFSCLRVVQLLCIDTSRATAYVDNVSLGPAL